MTELTGKINTQFETRKRKRKINKDDLIYKPLTYLLLILISVIVILPLLWLVGSSLNPGMSLFGSTMFPANPTLIHYRNLFFETDYLLWYRNTLTIATSNMVLSVILTTLTAYAFSRFRFKGRKFTLMLMLVLQMFPGFMAMTAVFVLLMHLGLLNTHLGLVLVYAGGQIPFNTWLAKGYFDGIPRSLDEAAKIDGASNLTIFKKIILPLARPIIAFIALVNFIGPWMDFIFPRLIPRTAGQRTLALGLYDMATGQQATHFTLFAAGAILVAVPITILFLFLQKLFIEGLTRGATKG